MNRFLFLAAGGLAGTFARYFLSVWIGRAQNSDFPYHTLAVNLAGCFILGAFIGFDKIKMLGHEWKLFAAAGFCGAFTTFSTLMMETAVLAEKGQAVPGLLNILISTAAGYLLFHLGLWAARIF